MENNNNGQIIGDFIEQYEPGTVPRLIKLLHKHYISDRGQDLLQEFFESRASIIQSTLSYADLCEMTDIESTLSVSPEIRSNLYNELIELHKVIKGFYAA